MKQKLITSVVLLLACCHSGFGQRLDKAGGVSNTQINDITSGNVDIGYGPAGITPVGGRLSVWSLPNFSRAPQFSMSSNSNMLIGANTSFSLFNRDLTLDNWARMHFATLLTNGVERDMVGLAAQFKNRASGAESADFVIATTDHGVYDERIRLNSNGNFGIGTYGSTPVPEKLNIIGNVSIGLDYGSSGSSPALPSNQNYLSFAGSNTGGVTLGTKNSDVLRMYRVNNNSNQSELRMELSDDFGQSGFGPDLFSIGGTGYGPFPTDFSTLFAADISLAAVGIGTRTPANRLEITSDIGLGQTPSGLRLTNLTSVAVPVVNPGTGILTVDANGDVIYAKEGAGYTASEGLTKDGTDFQLGQPCGTTPKSFFTKDREIHMGTPQKTYNLYFNGDINGTGGKIYMGSSSCPSLQARLEIGSAFLFPAAANSYSTSSASLSGLRFSNLTMSTPTITNATNGVLSLDANGDVIWVDDKTVSPANNGCSVSAGNIQLGESCDAPTGVAALLNNRLIPMNDNNVSFGDGNLFSAGKNRLGIGTTCTPAAKLEVRRLKETSIYDVTNRAIAGVNKDLAATTSGEASGVYGTADYIENRVTLGGDFLGANGRISSYGVRGVAQGGAGNQAFGGWFSACGANSINIGVFGDVCSGGGRNGVDWAGYFTGNIITTAPYIFSDRRVKQDIRPIEHALDIIGQIQPKIYKFNTNAFPGLNLPANQDNYGVIAQELEEVLPTLIKETPVPNADKKTFSTEMIKSVNYIELIPILIQAVKEQKTEIEQLKQQSDLVQNLQKQIDELKSLVKNSTTTAPTQPLNQLNVTLSEQTEIMLGQNIPNPCDKVTTIGFYIPASVQTATIQFATIEGRIVQTVPVQERGKGVINVYTSELNNGVYIYTLIADGRVIDTKRMEVLR